MNITGNLQCLQVPANEAVTVLFWIIPHKLGNIPITVRAKSAMAGDGVRRMLLVEVIFANVLIPRYLPFTMVIPPICQKVIREIVNLNKKYE